VINSSRFINQIMAYNEQCRFTAALITLNTDEVKEAAKAAGITGTGDTDLDRIIGLIREDLEAFKGKAEYAAIPSQWCPASFAIIPQPFGEDHGLVNSTMKLVRHKVRDFYRGRIDELYAAPGADPLLPGNREALREALK
jgi:long-chain acyl-CoA synthetase